MKKTMRILAALISVLALLGAGMALAETAETPAPASEVPMRASEPAVTPSPEDLGELTFIIEDGEGNEVETVRYSDFTDGKYTLEGLVPGTYTVREVDPDKLLNDYTFNEEESIQELTLEVVDREPVIGSTPLLNVYERTAEATPSPTPEPEGGDKINIPVKKIWEDQGNRDGNRPSRIMVNLMDGENRVLQAALSESNGWSYEFTDLPRYRNGKEIVYSVTEEPVPMYVASIDGFTITNYYKPPTTSATVSKVWVDNNNAAGLRPVSIYCTLSNGVHVMLSADNNWTATVSNLPAYVNGQPVTYTWSEQEAVGYSQTDKEVVGNTTLFTNTIIKRGEKPPEGKKTPKRTRGDNYLIIEDYGTPLGVEVIINHVGDCFD